MATHAESSKGPDSGETQLCSNQGFCVEVVEVKGQHRIVAEISRINSRGKDVDIKLNDAIQKPVISRLIARTLRRAEAKSETEHD